jgi:hypothetical protein
MISWFLFIRQSGMKEAKRKIMCLRDIGHAYITLGKMKDVNIQQFKALTVLHDGALLDNLLVQVARRNKLTTVTLQHGAFSPILDCMAIDANSILRGITSDYFLVWDKNSKQNAVMSGIDESRVVIAGIPKYIAYKRSKYQRDGFCVYLDASINSQFVECNKVMLLIANIIAKRQDVHCYVKFHPSERGDLYSKDLSKNMTVTRERNERILPRMLYIILSMSSVLLEAAYFETPVLRVITETEQADCYEPLGVDIAHTVEDAVNIIGSDRSFFERGLRRIRRVREELEIPINVYDKYCEIYNQLIEIG